MNTRKQTGFSTLVMVIILMFMVTSLALYTAMFSITEQKIAGNERRAIDALQAASSGVERVISRLRSDLFWQTPQMMDANGDGCIDMAVLSAKAGGGFECLPSPNVNKGILSDPLGPGLSYGATLVNPTPNDFTEFYIESVGCMEGCDCRAVRKSCRAYKVVALSMAVIKPVKSPPTRLPPSVMAAGDQPPALLVMEDVDMIDSNTFSVTAMRSTVAMAVGGTILPMTATDIAAIIPVGAATPLPLPLLFNNAVPVFANKNTLPVVVNQVGAPAHANPNAVRPVARVIPAIIGPPPALAVLVPAYTVFELPVGQTVISEGSPATIPSTVPPPPLALGLTGEAFFNNFIGHGFASHLLNALDPNFNANDLTPEITRSSRVLNSMEGLGVFIDCALQAAGYCTNNDLALAEASDKGNIIIINGNLTLATAKLWASEGVPMVLFVLGDFTVAANTTIRGFVYIRPTTASLPGTWQAPTLATLTVKGQLIIEGSLSMRGGGKLIVESTPTTEGSIRLVKLVSGIPGAWEEL